MTPSDVRDPRASTPAPAVVVTGATSGIGRATVDYLAQRGLAVFAGYRRTEDREALAALPRVTAVQIDITDEASLVEAGEQIAAAAPEGLGGLVNNAGIAVAGPLECLPVDRLRSVLETNVVGTVRTTQLLLPHLRRGRGRIVHIGSAAGSFSLPFVGPYAASKFAMEAITDSMRRELRAEQIPVVLIRPGRIATNIFDRAEGETSQMVQGLSQSQRQRYEPALERFQHLMHRSQSRRRDPRSVARVVHRALTCRRPRARYKVGADAFAAAQIAKFAPDWLSDAILARVLRP